MSNLRCQQNDNRRLSAMTPYEALQLVKEKLTCQQHMSTEQWCWVDPHVPDANHLLLCLHNIQTWATYLVCHVFTYAHSVYSISFTQLSHPDNLSCTVLPDIVHFTRLLETHQPRTASLNRMPTEPIIYDHDPLQYRTKTSGDLTESNIPPILRIPHNRGISC